MYICYRCGEIQLKKKLSFSSVHALDSVKGEREVGEPVTTQCGTMQPVTTDLNVVWRRDAL